jgi:hypothetical protein
MAIRFFSSFLSKWLPSRSLMVDERILDLPRRVNAPELPPLFSFPQAKETAGDESAMNRR